MKTQQWGQIAAQHWVVEMGIKSGNKEWYPNCPLFTAKTEKILKQANDFRLTPAWGF